MEGLRPFRAGYWFGGFNGLTWMVGLGTPMVLLAQQLGASAFQVGLASSFVFLLLPIQVVSTVALRRFGYQRQMISAWLVRACFLLVPLSIAWIAPTQPAPWMANALVASVFGFCLFRAFGTAAHLPWLAAILPVSLRGRFFATDHAITSVVGVATLLGCSVLFAQLPSYAAFRIAYGVAIAGSLLAVWNLARLPTAPPPATTPVRELAGEARRLMTSTGLFRHYLLLSLTGSVVTSSLGAFTVYYLKVETELASSRILVFTAAQFAGQIVGTWGIRQLIDRMSIRRFFQLSSVLIAAVDAFWLGLVTGLDLLAWVGVAYFGFGIAAGISNAAHFTYLPELSDDDRRPVSIAVFTAALGLLSGLAPMLWGLALRTESASPGIDVGRFAVFFGLGVGLSLLLALLFARLPDPRAGSGASSPG